MEPIKPFYQEIYAIKQKLDWPIDILCYPGIELDLPPEYRKFWIKWYGVTNSDIFTLTDQTFTFTLNLTNVQYLKKLDEIWNSFDKSTRDAVTIISELY